MLVSWPSIKFTKVLCFLILVKYIEFFEALRTEYRQHCFNLKSFLSLFIVCKDNQRLSNTMNIPRTCRPFNMRGSAFNNGEPDGMFICYFTAVYMSQRLELRFQAYCNDCCKISVSPSLVINCLN